MNKILLAKKGRKGLGVDVVAPILLGEGWNKLSNEQKKAYERQYDANWEFFDNQYQNKKKEQYDQVFSNPSLSVRENKSNPQSETIEIIEPKQSKLSPRVKKRANNDKWSYSRSQAAKLFGRSDLNTAVGVAQFQAAHGINSDGMLGKDTLRMLNKLYGTNVRLDQITHTKPKPKQYVANYTNPEGYSFYKGDDAIVYFDSNGNQIPVTSREDGLYSVNLNGAPFLLNENLRFYDDIPINKNALTQTPRLGLSPERMQELNTLLNTRYK